MTRLHNVHQQLPAFQGWLIWLPPSPHPTFSIRPTLPNSSPPDFWLPLCPALGALIPNRGTITLIETKLKDDCIGISNHPASMEKNKYQQKHHHKSFCQDKGRLPFLKVKCATSPRSCLPASPSMTAWGSPFPFLLRLPLCDSPMPNCLSVLVWQRADDSKDCHQAAAKISEWGKNAIGKNEGKQRLIEMKHMVTGLLTEHQLCSSAQAALLPPLTFTHLYNPRQIPAELCGL